MRIGRKATANAIAVLMLAATVYVPAVRAQWATAADAIPAAQLMQPDELNRTLHGPESARPLVLQVGSRMLFDEAHIPGSVYAGPGSSDAGLNVLRDRVKALPRGKFIVIYCGCCPWNRCPNVGPAYQMLHGMGFTQLKVLYIAQNFGTDWAGRGYPVDRGK